MAEFKKGKMSWDWRSIASYAEDHIAYDEDPIRPLVDAMIDTVFDEE